MEIGLEHPELPPNCIVQTVSFFLVSKAFKLLHQPTIGGQVNAGFKGFIPLPGQKIKDQALINNTYKYK